MNSNLHHSDSLPIRSERAKRLIERLETHVLVMDGAMGTSLQGFDLTAKDFGSTDAEGCNEVLSLNRPDLISGIHEGYLKAGCDIVETNTFGGTPLVLAEFGLEAKTHEINKESGRLAREACAKFETKEHPRFVAGSIGPTTKAISVTGGITFEELIEHFYQQAKGLIDGGVDYLLIETCQDTRNVKAALFGIDRAFFEKGERLPIAVSGTIEPMGTMLAGQSVEALFISLSHRNLLYLGLNCATGPEFMTDHIRSLAQLSPFRVACVPNAGLPDEHGHYLESPSMVSNVMERFLEKGWINLIGGCCGTHPGHIEALAALAKKYPPRKPEPITKSYLSEIDFLEMNEAERPYLVGERTNVIGSRKFKRLIQEAKFDEGSEIARAQVKAGAQLIDICLADPDRDESADMRSFLPYALKKVRAPLMIDSTDEKVIELSLAYCQGKALINSVNLEDGEERFEKVLPLAKKYGAAVVVGTIDDDPEHGMGVTAARKLEIAERAYPLLTMNYGIKPQDIYWDALVFPCATGDLKYIGSAKETIEALTLLKTRFPGTKTALGVSNVSFGLPANGREVLNSVFLYHCVQAGLDLAIVNTEKLERYASIPEEEKVLADNLLFNRGDDPITAFTNAFREERPKRLNQRDTLPLEERLSLAILEGSKEGLIQDLETALSKYSPLEIINGPLMHGMDQVGKLFNENKLIVAEVLQSAEVMKAAVGFLEPKMVKKADSIRGKVLLATVKGDVHDIGKNLVEIILSNNGFEVVNLGIKVPPEKLIEAQKLHRADLIGLSGLLVKSAQMMVLTAEDLSKSQIETPILVGGAALSRNFTDKFISKAYSTGFVEYAEDAMHGLELAKALTHPSQKDELKAKVLERRVQLLANGPTGKFIKPPSEKATTTRSTEVSFAEKLPPPDEIKHVIKNTPIEQIWKYINPMMLYARHLGVKGSSSKQILKAQTEPNLMWELKGNDPKAFEIHENVKNFMEKSKNTPQMMPSAIYRFFRAASEGNDLFLFDSSMKKIASFTFPRQNRAEGLCLSDYVAPYIPGETVSDSVALFITSVGKGVREESQRLRDAGKYLESHILQALAIESAEGYAEHLHSMIRKTWGFPDPIEMSLMEKFQAKYRGKRYSFGYPACPRLEDQTILFSLLDPKEIGVELTEGFMMDPEASVSAIAFHHPDATYFSVGSSLDENRTT